jgi:hypothetical protein
MNLFSGQAPNLGYFSMFRTSVVAPNAGTWFSGNSAIPQFRGQRGNSGDSLLNLKGGGIE